MKRFIPYYYLLFVLLMTGAFASMAQNKYGQSILGVVAIAFTVLFSIQLLTALNHKGKKYMEITELFCLIGISIIMTLRIFYIYFNGIEQIFVLLTGILILIYVLRILQILSSPIINNAGFKSVILIFYLSLVTYLLAMVTFPYSSAVSLTAGYVAFGLLILFVMGSWFSKTILVDGEKISGFQLVNRFRDRSVLLIALFFIFSLYTGLTSIGFLPKMYSNEYPQAYYKLLSNTGNSTLSSNELKKKQEEFKKKYDELIKHLAKDK